MPQAPKTYAAILAHIAHFLKVAIHTISSVRQVYPADSFLTVRAYNYPVRQSRHPGVGAWISSAVSAVHAELLKGTVARVVVAIAHTETCKVLERYVFDLEKLPVVKREEWETPIIRGETSAEQDQDRPDSADQAQRQQDKDPLRPGGVREHELADLTEQLRATLSAIMTCPQRLKPVPTGCTFTIAIELKDDADPPVGHPQPWVPVQPEMQRIKKGSDMSREDAANDDLYGVSQPDSSAETRQQRRQPEKESSIRRTIPMRAVDAGEVMFEMWVEEGKSKSELTESDFGGGSTESSGRVYE